MYDEMGFQTWNSGVIDIEEYGSKETDCNNSGCTFTYTNILCDSDKKIQNLCSKT